MRSPKGLQELMECGVLELMDALGACRGPVAPWSSWSVEVQPNSTAVEAPDASWTTRTGSLFARPLTPTKPCEELELVEAL